MNNAHTLCTILLFLCASLWPLRSSQASREEHVLTLTDANLNDTIETPGQSLLVVSYLGLLECSTCPKFFEA